MATGIYHAGKNGIGGSGGAEAANYYIVLA